jgi:Tfp pilus assembly protein PilX
MNIYQPMNRGFAIIYVLLIVSLMTAIVVALSFIFVTRIRIATEAHDSLRAIYAADSGLEWQLYVLRVGAIAQPTMSNQSSFAVDCPPPDGAACTAASTRLRSKGRYPATGSTLVIRRALEVTNFQ